MDKWQKVAAPVNVFYSYAPEDEKLQRSLEKHLASLRRQGLISDWHNYKIVAGSEREKSINSHLESASLILLLISPDFMASDYCYGLQVYWNIPLGRPGIILAGTFGLAGALGFGGLACIQHFVLRFLLWRSGQLPWNLPRFLDYAAERILLRKVGGGYIFMHRLLLEYFAVMGEDEVAD